MSASRFLTDHDHKSRAELWQASSARSSRGSGSGCRWLRPGVLHVLQSSWARDAGDAPVFYGVHVGREGLLVEPGPVELCVREVCSGCEICSHSAAVSRFWRLHCKLYQTYHRREQAEEIKPSTEVKTIEPSDDEHDTSDDEPNSSNTPTRPPNRK
ncbi:hypothetical protein J3458_014409 [Metarhizium acridum]|uniref:uncharacterized protein n=1 Tax=Metarhizium acridum TaxID=92637 RepID=UPI001C6AAA57|nr:hypothetical protein J3458_014409 [Metarhizium acridum]